MKPFSPLHSQLKFPKKNAFFKRLSLNLVPNFSLTNIKNAKKDFASNPPKRGSSKKQRVQKNKGFKKTKGSKKQRVQKERVQKKKGFKKKGFKKRKALKKKPLKKGVSQKARY
ncbi:hypothetical protein VN0604_01730 [Helicobacter pylori]